MDEAAYRPYRVNRPVSALHSTTIIPPSREFRFGLLLALRTVAPEVDSLVLDARCAERQRDDALRPAIRPALELARSEPHEFTRTDGHGPELRLERRRTGLDVEHLFLFVVAVIAEVEAIAGGEFVIVDGDAFGSEGGGERSEHVPGADERIDFLDGYLLHRRALNQIVDNSIDFLPIRLRFDRGERYSKCI